MLFDWTVLDTGGGGDRGGGKMRPSRNTSFASTRRQLEKQIKAKRTEFKEFDKVITQFPTVVNSAFLEKVAALRNEIDELRTELNELPAPFLKKGRAERDMLDTELRYDLSDGAYLTAKAIGLGHREFRSITEGIHPVWPFLLNNCENIRKTYIRGLKNAAKLVSMAVVTYRHVKSKTPRIVNVVICTEKNWPGKPRLYIELVCNGGESEGAMAVAMETLLVAAKSATAANGNPFTGICLSAAFLDLVPTYQRYTFEVTTDASKQFDVTKYAKYLQGTFRGSDEQAEKISEFLQVFQVVSLAALKKSSWDKDWSPRYNSFRDSLVAAGNKYIHDIIAPKRDYDPPEFYMDLSFEEKSPLSTEEQEKTARMEAFAAEMLTKHIDADVFIEEYTFFISPPKTPTLDEVLRMAAIMYPDLLSPSGEVPKPGPGV